MSAKELRDHRGNIAGREIDRPILFEEPSGECPEWTDGDIQGNAYRAGKRAGRIEAQGYRVPDEEIVQRLADPAADPAAEYVRRSGGEPERDPLAAALAQICRPLSDEAEVERVTKLSLEFDAEDAAEGAADLWEARERERAATAERLALAEDLLGEIIEYCEEDGHYAAWVDAARPFARFREESK